MVTKLRNYIIVRFKSATIKLYVYEYFIKFSEYSNTNTKDHSYTSIHEFYPWSLITLLF